MPTLPGKNAAIMAFAGLFATGACAQSDYHWRDVSGTGIHYFSTAIVHSQQPTQSGVVMRTTETIDLDGDLVGRVLYHPVTRIDNEAGTLVNRGQQVFSGTVLGIGPVMLHDDRFRFDVNLVTGETTGRVFLTNRLAGPITRCLLDISGIAEMTAEGDSIVSYSGRCRVLSDPGPNEAW